MGDPVYALTNTPVTQKYGMPTYTYTAWSQPNKEERRTKIGGEGQRA